MGTGGCKAVVFEPAGNILGYGFREYGIICDAPAKAEQDAEAVWRATLDALREAVSRSGIRSVEAIGLSVQGDAIIPVGHGFTPLHNALLGMDYRPAELAAECGRTIGARVLFDLTGMRPHPINSIVKALWLKQELPRVFHKAWKIVTYGDFILGRLGADPVIDWTMASRTMAFDLRRRSWATMVLDSLGIEPRLLSRAAPSGEAVGKLGTEAARMAGLEPGALLVTGGHDQTCAALGAGVNRAGIGVLSAGTADVLSTAFTEPKLNDEMFDGFYPCYLHAKRDMYFTFALNHIGGILFRWYRDTFGAEEVRKAAEASRDAYDLLVEGVPEGPSPVMILPHFNGSGNPVCDMSSRGAIVGLTLSTTRPDIVKAILECLAFESRINVDYWNGAGIEIEEFRAVGGGARSPRWLQIRSDILGSPVRTLQVREAACLGAAILAGAAAGVFASVDEGISRTVHLGQTYEPDVRRAERYAEKYGIYRRLYPALREVNALLGET
ncbi:MAG: FGGY-family carbohydrate kinase, partial [Tepidisphaeraceae bacterium]